MLEEGFVVKYILSFETIETSVSGDFRDVIKEPRKADGIS